jgi:transcriptional regulator with GAF, ATPase, and Fis domain
MMKSLCTSNELFGNERGSYPGALGTPGLFETADTGTILLDEIGDMPLPLQAVPLRVLEQREFHRVGGRRLVRIDVRVIAATNRNLKELVDQGKFRGDLYHFRG